MPLYMRIPKLRGFTSHRKPTVNVYTADLEKLGKTSVDPTVLAEAGLIESPYVKVKLIKNSDVTKKYTVKLTGASASAVTAIEEAGGSFEAIDQIKRPAKKPKTEK